MRLYKSICLVLISFLMFSLIGDDESINAETIEIKDGINIPPGKKLVYFTPFQITFSPGLQLCPRAYYIRGFRLNLYSGFNENLDGLDIGAGYSVVERNMTGFQFTGGISKAVKKATGFQLAGYQSVADTMHGFQFGGFGSTTQEVSGLQLSGGFSWSQDSVIGFQFGGVVAGSKGTLKGWQTAGITCMAKEANGLQISALVNYCEDLYGVQIGLVNISKNHFIPFFPIINIRF